MSLRKYDTTRGAGATGGTGGGSGSSTDIADGAVDTAQLADDAVTNAKMANNSVDTPELVADPVTQAKIDSGAVGATELATGAVISSKIFSNAVTNVKISSNAITSAKLNNNAVTNSKIANNAVTLAKMANNSVDTPELVADSVTQAKIAAGAVGSTEIANGAVGATQLAAAQTLPASPTDGQVVEWDATNSVWVAATPSSGGGSLTAGSVGTTELADNAVTLAKMANASVDTPELVAEAVTRAKIANLAISAAKINTGAVTAGKLADDQKLPTNPADGQVVQWDNTNSVWVAATLSGGGTISAGSIDTAQLADDAVTQAKIASGAVGATELATGQTLPATPTDGQVASWDATNSVWIATTPASGGGTPTIELVEWARTAAALSTTATTGSLTPGWTISDVGTALDFQQVSVPTNALTFPVDIPDEYLYIKIVGNRGGTDYASVRPPWGPGTGRADTPATRNSLELYFQYSRKIDLVFTNGNITTDHQTTLTMTGDGVVLPANSIVIIYGARLS